ncbi:hypothetical protein ACJX0J_005686 [Zea mays]
MKYETIHSMFFSCCVALNFLLVMIKGIDKIQFFQEKGKIFVNNNNFSFGLCPKSMNKIHVICAGVKFLVRLRIRRDVRGFGDDVWHSKITQSNKAKCRSSVEGPISKNEIFEEIP